MSSGTVPADGRKSAAGRGLSSARRWLLAALGLVSLGVGVVGIVVPGLPTTIFVLGAVYLFARSCPRLEQWVTEHRVFGAYLKMGQRGMPRRARVTAILMMWTAITVSVWMLRDGSVLARVAIVLLGLVGTGVLAFGLRKRPGPADASPGTAPDPADDGGA